MKSPPLILILKVSLLGDQTWEKITHLSKVIPPKRAAHSACISGNKMYIFGGYLYNNYFNDTYSFDFLTKTWTKINAKGNVPSGRRWNSCSVDSSGRIWIFGGYQSVDRFNDLFCFEPKKNKWFGPVIPEKPPTPRYSHTSVIYDNKLWIFGGYNGQEQSNEIFYFDFETNTWTDPLEIYGIVPEERAGHTAAVVGNKMLVFGGYNRTLNYMSDIFEFDFERKIWNKPNIIGKKPQVRSLHTCVVYQNDLYVFGGYNYNWLNDLYKLDTSIYRWEKVNGSGERPPGCYGHSAVCYKGCLYFFGGYSNKNEDRQFFNHLYAYRFVPVLVQDLKKLLYGQELCDIYFTSKEGEQYGSHSVIIQNRCAELIYHSDLLKNEKMKIIQSLLLFLYTDLVECTNFNHQDFISLLYLSKVLNLRKLESHLSRKLKHLITKENVVDILVAADKLFLKRIKSYCFRFILKYKELVIQCIDAKKLKSSPNLMMEYIQILSTGIDSTNRNSNKSLHSRDTNNNHNEDYHTIEEFSDQEFEENEKINNNDKTNNNTKNDKTFQKGSLYESFYKLYHNKKTSDFTLIVKDHKINCHKSILIARSELFRGMLTSIKDNTNKVTEMTGRSPKAIKALIKFFYTEQTDGIDPKIALELINASDYYGLNLECKLEEKCTEIVKNNINSSNALPILKKALLLDINSLKQATIDFIIKNGKQVINEPIFNKSKNVDLFRELTRILLERQINSDQQEIYK
ncbi:hypothetical protein M0812_21130 [Anaeramoeba flamelloides]|uniref:BTB domain-containing protein n=1 Tax=Anaeramoeba flamelloides TaxID=1746091 RepID=A0AAV7YTP0_9EUKA|nr:hypothetical protein M0812_21130 [Anaeramoeba flamelloides]